MSTQSVEEERRSTAAGYDWSPALTLTERRDLHRAAGGAAPDAVPPEDAEDLVRRHQYWAKEPVHATPEDLERRLALDGISLGEYAALSRGVALPDGARRRWPWVAHLDAVCDAWAALQDGPADAGEEHPAFTAMATVIVPFARALERDVAAEVAQLREQDPHGILGDPGLVRSLLTGFGERAREFAFPAALLELHVVRHEAALGEGELVPAAELLRERLRGQGGPAFLAEYPVLGRLLAELALQYRRNAVQLARRVRDDAGVLASTFAGGEDLGRLVEVSEPWGDAHQDGQTVRALRFSGGSRVLYKPRPLAVDVFVADFLRWLNGRGIEATQRPVTAVDRGSYGWTEVIEAAPCASPDDVERFYRRQGGLVAVCHVLVAKDLHFENVIAEGAHPVAVDLEGFFQPAIPADEGEQPFAGGSLELIETGLLPSGMMQVGEEFAAFDGSGMAGSGGVLPMTVMRISSPEQGLRFKPANMELDTQPNLPVLDGRRVPPRRHAEAVIAGFEEVAAAIRDGRDELTGPGGLLERAAGLPIRIFLRASNVYGRLVAGSHHPDLLRDAMDRERLFDWLVAGEEGTPLYRAAFPHERAGLLVGDVPMFVSRSDAHEILATGGEPIGASLRRTGLELAHERVDRLDDDRIEDLAWVVRAGIAATARQGEDPAWPVVEAGSAPAGPARAEDLRRRAAAIAGVLARRAERGPLGTTWLGLALAGSEGWTLRPLDTDLYNGTSGVVLFLAYAGACTGEQRFTDTARAGADMLRRTWERRLEHRRRGEGLGVGVIGGAFGELGGTVLALTHLAALWDRDDLARDALELTRVLEHRLDDVTESDVLAGVAGTLAVALTLHEVVPDDGLRHLATRCGELLAGRAEQHAGGVAWPTGEGFRLAGFAHGAAGIGASLARLGKLTGHERWSDLAAGALVFERSLFSEEHGNWRDARPPAAGGDPGHPYPAFWCHGATGVALGRTVLEEPAGEVARDLAAAAAAVAATRRHPTHSLCHGALGNLLVLRRCARVAPELVPGGIDRVTGDAAASVARSRLVCGVPDGVATPGFMLGLAGIGYALLALADPALPEVIGLDDLPR